MNVVTAPRPLPARFRRAERAAVASSFVRSIDWILVGTVGALVAYGLWAIGGITRHDVAGNEDYYLVRQAVYAAMGGVVLVAAMLVPTDRLREGRRGVYGVLVGLLLLVLLSAEFTRGSKRWIDVGFFQFQPSEFGKVLFVLVLAGLVADAGDRIGEWSTVLRVLGVALVPIALVFVQPDLGTSLVYCAAGAAILFLGGTRWRHLFVLGSLAAFVGVALLWALPAAGVEVLKPYQTERLTAFADPESDPSGATYNLNQSITAVGAGGLRGRGIDGATQTNLDYLPEHATDFVFASLAEQRGFVGAHRPAPPLPAAALARDPDPLARPRRVLDARRRRDRVRVPVPGVRQRRDDDGARSGDRDPAAVRLGRRLVDDHEPPGDGAPVGDPRARPHGAASVETRR